MSPKDEYRRVYFEALGLAVTSIRTRFDQKGFKISLMWSSFFLRHVEQRGVGCILCIFFHDDCNKEDLVAELSTLCTLYHSAAQDEVPVPTVNGIKTALLTLSTAQRMLLNTVCRLFQLLLILPATNATSERSFSALCRIKTYYMRSTMSQASLNHLMILRYHQDITDKLDLKSDANAEV